MQGCLKPWQPRVTVMERWRIQRRLTNSKRLGTGNVFRMRCEVQRPRTAHASTFLALYSDGIERACPMRARSICKADRLDQTDDRDAWNRLSGIALAWSLVPRKQWWRS